MRILIVTPLYPPDLGSLALYVKALAQRLSTKHTVTIATYSHLPEGLPEVRFICTPKRWPTWMRLPVFTLRLWRAARNADVLYVSDGASVGFPSVLVSTLRRLPLLRFVMEDESWERTIHAQKLASAEQESIPTLLSDRKTQWIQRLQTWVLQRADYTFVPTSLHETRFRPIYHTKGEILPCPTEPLLVLPFPPEPVAHQLLFTSTLTQHCGIMTVLLALKEVRETIPDVRLIIANDGPEASHMKEQIAKLGVESHVHFLGRVSRAEKQDLLRNSSICLCLQPSGACIRDVYDAYARAIPVIISTEIASKEVLVPEQSGLVVHSEDPTDLVQAILRLLQNPSLYQRLSNGGQAFLKQKLGWEPHLRTLITTIERLCQPSQNV